MRLQLETFMLLVIGGAGVMVGYESGKRAADAWYSEQYQWMHRQIVGIDAQKKCRVWALSDKVPGTVESIDIPCDTDLAEGTMTQIVKPKR